MLNWALVIHFYIEDLVHKEKVLGIRHQNSMNLTSMKKVDLNVIQSHAAKDAYT